MRPPCLVLTDQSVQILCGGAMHLPQLRVIGLRGVHRRGRLLQPQPNVEYSNAAVSA